MSTEDDTFRILSRCTYEELQTRLGGGRESVLSYYYLSKEARDKIITDSHWTVHKWKIELNRRYGRLSK